MTKKLYLSLLTLVTTIIIYTKSSSQMLYIFISVLALFSIIKKEGLFKYTFFISLLGIISLNIFVTDQRLDVGEEYLIQGEVIRAFDKKDDYQRVIVRTSKINEDNKKINISLQLIKMDELSQYDIISSSIKVKEISGYKNFGLVSTEDYYFIDNISNQARVEKISRIPTNKFLKNKKLDVRGYISNTIENNLEERNAGVIKKLLLNDNSNLDEEVDEVYRINGLSHILAISGLHIGVLIYLLDFILKKLKVRYNARFLLISIFLAYYSFLLDFTPSVTRAVLMYIIFISTEMNKIYITRLDLMLLTMIVLLLINPLWIYKLGFQLSFLSVYGIIVIYEKLFKKRSNNKLVQSIYIYLSVNIMIFPLLIYRFNSFNLLSLVSNLLLTPVLSIVLILSILAIILGKITILSKLLFQAINILLNFSSFYMEILSDRFSLNISFLLPSLIALVLYYILLFYLLDKDRNQVLYNNRYIFYCLIIFSQIYQVLNPQGLTLGFYDVGNGDSAYIFYKDKYYQFDTGGSAFGNYNPGKEITSKAISDRGVRKIDILLLTHFDSDHVLGTEDLLDKGLVDNIIINRKSEGEEVYQLIRNSQVNYVVPKDKARFIVDDELEFQFFNAGNYSVKDENKASLISLVNYKDKKILIGGDATIDMEEFYMEEIGDIDILKVGHHGSKTSSSLKFLENVKPEYSVISTGKNNMYGHPSSEVIENLKKVKTNILRTDQLGEIIFTIDDKISYTYYNEEWYKRIDMETIFFSIFILIFCMLGCEVEDEVQGF